MIGVIDSQQEWDALLACFEHSDFYHTYGYHRIAKDKSDHPIMIRYSENDKIIALPLLLRQIEGTPYMNATSVYGYPGALTKNIDAQFNNASFSHLLQELFLEKNIVSVFPRLNPFIPYPGTLLWHSSTIK